MPLRVAPGGGTELMARPLVRVDHPGVIVEAAKAAEDGSGDIVIRCYESLGGRADATLSFDRPMAAVRLVDLMEDERDDLPEAALVHEAGAATVAISVRPFQIVTLRLTPS
jgi:alpha-mannosidase